MLNYSAVRYAYLRAFTLTHVLKLIIALGIPVGVLNAGSSLSATCTAFALNTYTQYHIQIISTELQCELTHLVLCQCIQAQ